MVKRLAIFLLVLLVNHGMYGQTMEEKVTVYLETFLSGHKSSLSTDQLKDTEWATSDLMGQSIIYFDSNKKFNIKNNGFQASTRKIKGRWYINNEYVILEVKKEKTPLFILKNGDRVVLVDDDQIDVLKQLLTEASYKDGALKPYSYYEIFTFLNAYTLKE